MSDQRIEIHVDRLRPRFMSSEGGALPAPISAVGSILDALPEPARLAATRVLEKARVRGRLPAMIVKYEDGFMFGIRSGDPTYTYIYFRGAWEPSGSYAIRALLRPGDFAIDIGANYGWFTLLMATSVGQSGLVWAIEPVPPFADVLRHNVSLNSFNTIRVLDCAVGGAAAEVNINVFAGLPHGHASASTFDRDDYVSYPAAVRSLDQLLDHAEVRSPAVIKVDVEGYEMQVLAGSERLARSADPPIWMFEVNHETSAAFGYEPVDLVKQLRAYADYRVFGLARSRLQRRFFLVPLDYPERSGHGEAWICVPPSRLKRLRRAL